MSFINLNVKSCYSLLESTIEINALIQYALERKWDTLSLVEDGNMHSAIKFYQACTKANIRPIIGVSLKVMTQTITSKWTLFARNQLGYRILLKLTSDFELNGVVKDEDVLEHAAHLVICVDMRHDNLTFSFQIPEHFYLSFSQIEQLEMAKSLQHLNLPYVFLNEVRVLNDDEVPVLKVLSGIKNNIKVSEVKLLDHVACLTSRQVKQMKAHDEFLALAMTNTSEIANVCDIVLDLKGYLLPKFEVSSDIKTTEYLKALCIRGAKRRYKEAISVSHYERLKYELDIIFSMGFADYFLIVWDFVKYAKTQGISVGPGRGSAAGSMVSYVLGITDVDPIKYNLLFERFLNPERISLPDIDIDFQDDRRDEVIGYVQKKYGAFSVCQIATFGTFATRSSWRDTARVFGLETPQINGVTRHLTSKLSLVKNLSENVALQKHLEAHESQKAIYTIAMSIEGLPRHVSTHAAGVIISPNDLRNFTALMKGGSSDIHLSQYEAADLESVGLLKMDFLGLRNLTMIEEISTLIRDEIDETFHISNIPLDDKLTYELIASANTTGIFQLESSGMRAALRQVLPSNIEDIISVLALFRPGPMAHIPLFSARKHGQKQITYDHASLEPILKNTYGIIVYQEQIMQIATQVAGYSLGESDILRRAISKKEKRIMEEEGAKFIKQAEERGYGRPVAEKIFDLILRFANYGFPRSHAASYAMISYQMAYLKANYPHYFLVSVLMTQMGSAKGTAAAIKEARQLGISVLPPSINESIKGYRVSSGEIRLGFLSIRHIGLEVANKLVEERKKGRFTTFYDFLKRTNQFLGEKLIGNLIDVGACDEFGYTRCVLHQNIKNVLAHLQYGPIANVAFEMEKSQTEEMSHLQLMEQEQELLGFYLETHPIHLFSDLIKEKKWVLPSEISQVNLTSLVCIGFVSRVREIRDKNGNLMAFLELTDETEQLDVTIFAREYQTEYKQLPGKVIVIEGRPQLRNERWGLNFNRLISTLM